MKDLQLIKSENFGNVQCDFYRDEDEIYLTREQIGAALEYANPQKAMDNMHAKHKERLNKFSVTLKVRGTDGKMYNTYLYTRKGIMEICRWSQQPKADTFMDWVWEVMDSLIAGKTKLVPMTDYQKMIAETRMQNVRTRKAQLLSKLADQYDGTFKQVLHAYATKELTGEYLLPLPKLPEKTLSASEIGEILGITANMVGILTNRHGLKTAEYGAYFNDKARGHNKEVQTFRYYESVIPVLEAILRGKSA